MIYLLTTVIVLGVAGSESRASTGAPEVEYTVKAAYLYNFAKFVDWSGAAASGAAASGAVATGGGARDGAASGPLRLCILGEDPFGPVIDPIEEKKAKGRPIEVVRLETLTEGCHILYVSASESSRLAEVLTPLRDLGVLTVSDIEGFARSGGMIGFVTRRGTIRFEVNLTVIERTGLRISAKVLELSRIVSSEKER